MNFELGRSAALPLLALCSQLLLGAGPAAEVVPSRAWDGPSVNLWGSPSPDGRWLSFVDGETGSLAVRDLADGSTRRVTRAPGPRSGEFAYFSVFDRDGDRLAYAWFGPAGRYELRVVGFDPGSDRPASHETIYSNAEIPFVQPCAWSRDGSQLLVLFFREDSTSQIALFNLETGQVRALRSLQWIYPKRMDLSPDGRYIVYDSLSGPDGEERDLYLLRTDGSSERRLLAGAASDESPVWSHDGSTVWFVSDRGGGHGIWSVPVRDGEAAAEPRLVAGNLPRILLMGATSSGKVYFGRRVGAPRLYVQEWNKAEGGPVSAPAAMSDEEPDRGRSLPVFAPDGERVAFLARVGTENQGRGHSSVVLQSLQGGGSERLETGLTFVRAMSFSPDGSLLLLSGSDRRSRAGLFLHDLASQRTRLIEPAEDAGVDGLPGAFGRGGESVLVLVEGPATGTQTLVERSLPRGGLDRRIADLPAGARVSSIASSPDGVRVALAWISDGEPPEATVAVVERAGGAAEPILTSPGGELNGLAWAPGGAELLVGTQGASGARLWQVGADGGSLQELPSHKDRLPGLSFSPDGSWLAYAAGRTSEEVWVAADGGRLEH